jgi:hypothetical protein
MRRAATDPPPRRHRHHYAGVFAPHARWRARDPPDLDTGLAFDFDQRTPADPSFDQTLR